MAFDIRRQLPVMQLNFGGADGRGGKMARFELGPVYCSGSAADQDAAAGWREGPRSCRDLWRRGVTQVCKRMRVEKSSYGVTIAFSTQVGYYLVKMPSRKAKYPRQVQIPPPTSGRRQCY